MTPPLFESRKNGFTISTDPARLDLDTMHDYLANRSYWARGIPRAVLEKSNQNSLCFGVYRGEQQVGFARVISDYATFAYIEDLFILEDYQGQGLGKWLMACIRAHPELQGLRRWMLLTRDAHGLYAQYGFQPLSRPERHMEISVPGIYQRY
jgi:GNAT superfamily N-acetyltransferase